MPDQDNSVPRGRLRRTVPLAGFAARAAGGRLAAEVRERTGDDGAVERFHERTADRYAELLGNYRGVLMKVGQMLDTDALSAAGYTHYQRALSRLPRRRSGDWSLRSSAKSWMSVAPFAERVFRRILG